jgi:hypothetical protein
MKYNHSKADIELQIHLFSKMFPRTNQTQLRKLAIKNLDMLEDVEAELVKEARPEAEDE